jgi:hypothetical protein
VFLANVLCQPGEVQTDQAVIDAYVGVAHDDPEEIYA